MGQARYIAGRMQGLLRDIFMAAGYHDDPLSETILLWLGCFGALQMTEIERLTFEDALSCPGAILVRGDSGPRLVPRTVFFTMLVEALKEDRGATLAEPVLLPQDIPDADEFFRVLPANLGMELWYAGVSMVVIWDILGGLAARPLNVIPHASLEAATPVIADLERQIMMPVWVRHGSAAEPWES